MPRYDCYRRECKGFRSEFGAFLSRRHHPPQFEGHVFCSEACLQAYMRDECIRRWQRMQQGRNRRIPRPRLGAILMETAFITRDQLDQAIRLQRVTREGRVGEWLRRLGFVDERQITVALAKQCGLPLINLKNSEARGDAVGMIPAQVARCSNLLPVSYDDDQGSLRIAISGPVDFNLQQALRRMIGKDISAFVGDESAIQSLMNRWYEPEELDPSRMRHFSALEELLDILKDTVSIAVSQRSTNIRAEFLEKCFWARLDNGSRSEHLIYPYVPAQGHEEEAPVHGASAYVAASSAEW